MRNSVSFQTILNPITAAIPVFILFVTLLSVPLSAADTMQLTNPQISSWLFMGYGVAGALSLILSIIYRQPFIVTSSIFVLIFVASLADQVPYPELIGACIVAGIVVTLITLLGVSAWIAKLIPEPIVLGLLSGAILPIVTSIFRGIETHPVIIGSTFIAYILGRWLLQNRLPAILPAVIIGLLATAITGQFGQSDATLTLPQLTITAPIFSLNSLASITPIFVVLIILQANVPSMIFMESQGFKPPTRLINVISGIGTTLTSFLGPTGIGLSLPLTAIVAGANAGDKQFRYHAIFYAGTFSILIALLSGIATALPQIIPIALLNALAGLSMFDVLLSALGNTLKGPVRIGPLFTFVIAVSQMSFLGFGASFWALLGGTMITRLLERDELALLQADKIEREQST